KFVEAYRAEGVNLYAVHVQNEPNSCQVFPSCIWTSEALRDFIGKYLGPEFDKHQLNTDIWLGTIERPSVEKVDTVLTDSLARRYVKGVGFQWAGRGAIAGVHFKYPAMKLMQTETECGNGSNDWDAAEHTWDLILHYLNNGANAYMYWNIVLDETGKSQWGWKQNSMISVNTQTGKSVLHPEYYLMKHLSHYVKPGSKRLRTEGSEDALAFVNPDGSKVMIVYNRNDTGKSFKIRFDDQSFRAHLNPKSFNTFFIKI
ncbi:MAG TPA: glycoside hydrolase family 30 beta sandwich domain-containing protein, partial [Bacteroidales bacterium]|nr:glycoside hydrolase family 30 beta sandwich domain-containing protein [Bacteroidales bacterium]